MSFEGVIGTFLSASELGPTLTERVLCGECRAAHFARKKRGRGQRKNERQGDQPSKPRGARVHGIERQVPGSDRRRREAHPDGARGDRGHGQHQRGVAGIVLGADGADTFGNECEPDEPLCGKPMRAGRTEVLS